MKTALLLAALLLLAVCGGSFAFAIHTKHRARARLVLHLLGERYNVWGRITPTFGQPTGAYSYCDRIYSVSFQVRHGDKN